MTAATSASNRPAVAGESAQAWFAAHGWQPFAFQREVWAAMSAGESGLLHATTGSGKTYAVWFGALARAAALGVPMRGPTAPPLGVLWLTPMRALAADSARAMRAPLEELGIALVDRHPHRRHGGDRARAAGPALPDRARHDARVAQPDADARSGARRARRRPHRDRRRVARADGIQARRSGAARARAAEALEPGARRLGPVGDARQPRRSDARPARRRARPDRARPDREEPRHRHLAARRTRAASRGAATSASRCSSRSSTRSRARRRRSSSSTCARRPRPGTSSSSTRGPTGRASSRCTTDRSTRTCATGSSSASRKGA